MKTAALLFMVFAVACAPAPGTGSTPKGGSTMPSSIIDPYLKIQTALAKDGLDEVKANAGNIATAATALGSPAIKIDMAAVQLTAAGDLADAREKFGVLSQALVTYMDGLHLKAPEGVHVAFCPMKAKPWLQEGTSINNPYFGSTMLTCGSIRP